MLGVLAFVGLLGMHGLTATTANACAAAQTHPQAHASHPSPEAMALESHAKPRAVAEAGVVALPVNAAEDASGAHHALMCVAILASGALVFAARTLALTFGPVPGWRSADRGARIDSDLQPELARLCRWRT